MSHMPTFLQPGASSGNRMLGSYLYTASGVEGAVPHTDFRITHGLGLVFGYLIEWTPEGVAAVPVLDFPNAPGDRDANSFRVLSSVPLTFGDKIRFQFSFYST